VFWEVPSAASDARDSRREKYIARRVEDGQLLEALINGNGDEGIEKCQSPQDELFCCCSPVVSTSLNI
jgi:hypothetical protein